jgi:hypothetical protein
MAFSKLIAGLALSLSLPLVFACAPDPGGDAGAGVREESAVMDGALELPFEVLDLRKDNADPALTVIKTKAAFQAFFGFAAPASINFNKSWVLHFSTGVKNTGGYAANIVGVDRNGAGVNRKITVTTEDVSPGPGCIVTQAFTNPQMTVKIKKQSGIPVEQVSTETITDCSEPDFCTRALCPEGTVCNEEQDACVTPSVCQYVKCANGYECSDEAGGCVPRACDPDVADTCPENFACENHIVCITAPCPGDFRCYPVEQDPCQGISYEGTCEGNTLKYCESQQLNVIDCGDYAATCGFSASQSYYDCL